MHLRFNWAYMIHSRFKFTCPSSALARLTSAVTGSDISKELLSSELIYAPVDKVESSDEELEGKVKELVEDLEEDEDTLRVWTTIDR